MLKANNSRERRSAFRCGHSFSRSAAGPSIATHLLLSSALALPCAFLHISPNALFFSVISVTMKTALASSVLALALHTSLGAVSLQNPDAADGKPEKPPRFNEYVVLDGHNQANDYTLPRPEDYVEYVGELLWP